jgi:hypothetical protein
MNQTTFAIGALAVGAFSVIIVLWQMSALTYARKWAYRGAVVYRRRLVVDSHISTVSLSSAVSSGELESIGACTTLSTDDHLLFCMAWIPIRCKASMGPWYQCTGELQWTRPEEELTMTVRVAPCAVTSLALGLVFLGWFGWEIKEIATITAFLLVVISFNLAAFLLYTKPKLNKLFVTVSDSIKLQVATTK